MRFGYLSEHHHHGEQYDEAESASLVLAVNAIHRWAPVVTGIGH